jgi:hypothetical protein
MRGTKLKPANTSSPFGDLDDISTPDDLAFDYLDDLERFEALEKLDPDFAKRWDQPPVAQPGRKAARNYDPLAIRETAKKRACV